MLRDSVTHTDGSIPINVLRLIISARQRTVHLYICVSRLFACNFTRIAGTAMLFTAFAVLSAGLHLVGATQVALQSTGRTLVLGGIPYFLPPAPVSALHDTSVLSKAKESASNGLVPFSVIPIERLVFDGADLDEIVAAWSTKDDVWSKEFLTGT